MIVSTMNDLPGHEIVEVLGDVFGVTVFVRGAGSNIEAGLRTFFGGEARGLAAQLTESREQARRKLIEAAEAQGADAVLAMRYQTNELRDIGTEICAYGTAVRLREKS
jgi:uncharacterized protein YbjQ (UPF0145 family)